MRTMAIETEWAYNATKNGNSSLMEWESISDRILRA